MCTTNLYTYVHQDGRTEQTYQPSLCAASRHGQPCANEVVFQHPLQYLSYETSPYAAAQLPPTPNYSPRSSTPNYRSGDDSDRSHHSSSSSKKRPSGVYVNGKKVLDLQPKDRNRSSRRDHIVVVDPPRTPPSSWTASRSAPASPKSYAIGSSSHASSSRRRSVVFDDHPQVQIEVFDAAPRSKHSRHASTSSRDSRHSDEEKQRRRRKRREEREQEELEIREQRLRARIAEANAEIAGRPAVPAAPAPRRASTYKRGAVEVHDAETELIEAVRRLDFEEARREEKARRLAKKEAEKEEEAQRQRLVDRMTMSRRRATVSHGPRPYIYDGMY